MSEINLLPQELKPDVKVLKLSKSLRNLALVAIILFVFSLVLFFVSSYFIDYRISVVSAKQKDLESQIKAMEKTEQRLVLIKDRLNKIGTIVENPRANDEVIRLSSVTSLFPDNTFVEEIELEKNNAVVAILAENLDTVASYLATVISSGNFSKINLAYLKFDPEEGYKIGISFPE